MIATKKYGALALTASIAAVLMGFLGAALVVRAGETSVRTPKAGPLVELYREAVKEGSVSVWSTNAEEMRWITDAFQTSYPGIRVEIVTDLNVVSRVVTEARAGRNATDVVWSSEALVRPLIERELLLQDAWERFGVRREDVGAEGHMLISNSVAFAVAYRKDRVSASDVPRKWSELLDAKYRGKMAAGPILFARLSAALGAFENEAALLEYARAFRRDSKTLWTNDLLEQTIASGERPYVVAITSYLAEGWKARGVPVEVVLPEPVYVTQFGAVIARRAPHPNAAKLLAVWLSGPQGRKARDAAHMGADLRPSSDHPKAVELRASGKLVYVDSKEAREIRNRLIPEMDRIMAGL
jgi:iron(III) transport system substrate-binding protein